MAHGVGGDRWDRILKRRALVADEAGPTQAATAPISAVVNRAPPTTRTFRLAAVTSHPVQYQAPLFQRLAAHSSIDLTVYYGHDGSIAGELDREFGIPIAWDRPLLAGYRSVFLTRRERRLGWLGQAARQMTVLLHLWRGRYDAVFIHSYATWLSLMAYLGAWLSRTPVLLRTESHLLRPRHAIIAAAKNLILRKLFRHTAAFLVIGEANRRFYEFLGVTEKMMFWTPYSVDNEYLSAEQRRLAPDRDAIRREVGIAPGHLVVVYSGKLIELKRIEDLIQALKLLSAESQPAELLIIGEGPRRELLTKLASELGMRVTFAGFQNQTQLARYYLCGDIFVLPSTRETWGLVLNEAMLFGMPVVTTSAVGAGADLVVADVTGYTFEPGDCVTLAKHLDMLLNDPDARRRMGEAARCRISAYTYAEGVNGVLAALGCVTSDMP